MKIFKNIEKFKYVICDGKCNKCLHYCNPNSNIDNNKELIEEPLLNEILIKRSYECNGLCSACKKKNCDGDYLEVRKNTWISRSIIFILLSY